MSSLYAITCVYSKAPENMEYGIMEQQNNE